MPRDFLKRDGRTLSTKEWDEATTLAESLLNEVEDLSLNMLKIRIEELWIVLKGQ